MDRLTEAWKTQKEGQLMVLDMSVIRSKMGH